MFLKKPFLLLVLLLIIICQSTVPPCGDTELIVDGITITAEGIWYADHEPIIPPEGPSFSVFLDVIVENSSDEDIQNFRATKITLYYDNTEDEFASFGLIPPEQFTITSGMTDTLTYRSKEEFYSDIKEGTMLYGCIELKWLGGKGILATLPSPVEYLH